VPLRSTDSIIGESTSVCIASRCARFTAVLHANC
jgi:hypothetical protein